MSNQKPIYRVTVHLMENRDLVFEEVEDAQMKENLLIVAGKQNGKNVLRWIPQNLIHDVYIEEA